MNERIKELQFQAAAQVSPLLEGSEWQRVFTEKFAELIVAECMEVCRQGKYGRKDDLDTIHFDNGIRFCINAIDEHFGD